MNRTPSGAPSEKLSPPLSVTQPAGDKADIELAVAAVRRAFKSGPSSRISPGERSRLVWQLGHLLEQHADEFAELQALDDGKPITRA